MSNVHRSLLLSPFFSLAQPVKRLGLLLITISALWSGSLMAHQQKETYSTLSFNARHRGLEVVHRFYIHDAEHALGRLLNKKIDLMNDPSAQQAFGAYIGKHFQLKTLKSDQPLTLQFVGQEVEGRYLWVYQEAPDFTKNDALHGQSNLPKPHGLKVKMDALQELWRRQVNQVNVETDEKLNPSIRLKKQDRWRTLYF